MTSCYSFEKACFAFIFKMAILAFCALTIMEVYKWYSLRAVWSNGFDSNTLLNRNYKNNLIKYHCSVCVLYVANGMRDGYAMSGIGLNK